MKNHRYVFGVLASLQSLITGCDGPAEPEAAPPSVLVEIQPAESRSIRETLTAYGTAEFAPSAVANLVVQYEARIVKVWVVVGDSVKKRQPIVDLAASAVAQLDLDKARRDAKAASAERERNVRLRSQGLATESELQSAANTAASARQLRDSLTARAGVGGKKTLVAPQDGIVDALTGQQGDVLPSGSTVARIAEPDSLIVRLGVEPEDVSHLAVGQTVQVESLTPGVDAITTRIVSVDRRVDPQAHLATAVVQIPHGSGLLPGAPVRAEIVLSTHENVVSVRRAAVLYAGDEAYVFVAADKTAHRRAVHVGVQDDGYVEVLDGVKTGESVIAAGNYELEDGMAIRSAPGSPQ